MGSPFSFGALLLNTHLLIPMKQLLMTNNYGDGVRASRATSSGGMLN